MPAPFYPLCFSIKEPFSIFSISIFSIFSVPSKIASYIFATLVLIIFKANLLKGLLKMHFERMISI